MAKASSLLLLGVLSMAVLYRSTSAVYFNPMMSCREFCQMLTKDKIRQLYCILGMCKDDALRRRLMNVSKRGGSFQEPDVLDRDYGNGAADVIMSPSALSLIMDSLADKTHSKKLVRRETNSVKEKTDRPHKQGSRS